MNTVDGYLLDTNVASACWDAGSSNHEAFKKKLEELEGHLVYISAVSIGEVEYGLHVAPIIDAERQMVVKNAMSSYQTIAITEHTARTYAAIRASLFKEHSPRTQRGTLTRKRPENLTDKTTGRELGIQENDLWIMSVAVEQNLFLVTNDRMKRIVEAANYADRTKYW